MRLQPPPIEITWGGRIQIVKSHSYNESLINLGKEPPYRRKRSRVPRNRKADTPGYALFI